MKNVHTLFLIFLFSVQYTFSQERSRTDSLERVLITAKEDTSKVNTLNALSRAYWERQNLDKAQQPANLALKLSQEINFKKGEADAYNNSGTIFYFQGDYSQAIKAYTASLQLYKNINNIKGISTQYNNLGIVFTAKGEYNKAIENYKASLELKRSLGDKKGEADLINNIGVIFNFQGNYPEALKSYYAALKVYEELGNKKEIANAYTNIGIINNKQKDSEEALKNYHKALKIYREIDFKEGIAKAHLNIGSAFEAQKKYSNALIEYQEALKINNELTDKQTAGYIYSNIGTVYYTIDNYSEAEKNYLKSLKIRTEIGDDDGLASCYINLGTLYIDIKKYTMAREYLQKGLTLSKEIGSMDAIKDSYHGLSDLDSLQGNYKSALENYELYVAYRDSLFNEENTKKTVQLQMQYDFEKKESEIIAEQEKKDLIIKKELQRQKLVRNVFFGGFSVMLLFAGVFFTQRNRIKKGKRRSDELLLNILPAEVAEELKKNGSAEAKQFDDVTVMFTDFKNFTHISEKLSPSELVAEIDYYFKAFDKIMDKFNIEKIKTIGDSYMAAGGLPVANKTNAVDVVKAALEIEKFIDKKLEEERANGKEQFEIRIGIHTGPVVAGIVGIKKFAYDIWGDTVNIASRMENSGEPGRINISGTTYEQVKSKFKCTYRGKIEAKNKGMIDMYFVEN
jgi:class 3 adenylate cyclase/Tfp pilus assembly protein PilF